ncbi:hypothetical protein [Nostoc sp.]|uniref:hypothetical protein n=1 Tax=Nostoc sp. TaxID=1180 RepID=UPI002FFCFF51
MANLPPINSVVKVIKTVAHQDLRLGQTGTVIQYSGHRKSLRSFPRYAASPRNFFQFSSLKNRRVIGSIMPRKSTHPTSADHSSLCLQYLRRCGGSARLCTINFSLNVIQTLVNRKLVKVTNTGAGFFVELDEAE